MGCVVVCEVKVPCVIVIVVTLCVFERFDLRLYLLIMGYRPLRIYLYRDGIARFASQVLRFIIIIIIIIILLLLCCYCDRL
jgi:hypothetical protein